jgi:hypothetical protein
MHTPPAKKLKRLFETKINNSDEDIYISNIFVYSRNPKYIYGELGFNLFKKNSFDDLINHVESLFKLANDKHKEWNYEAYPPNNPTYNLTS